MSYKALLSVCCSQASVPLRYLSRYTAGHYHPGERKIQSPETRRNVQHTRLPDYQARQQTFIEHINNFTSINKFLPTTRTKHSKFYAKSWISTPEVFLKNAFTSQSFAGAQFSLWSFLKLSRMKCWSCTFILHIPITSHRLITVVSYYILVPTKQKIFRHFAGVKTEIYEFLPRIPLLYVLNWERV